MDTPVLERLVFNRGRGVFLPSPELEAVYLEWFYRVAEYTDKYGFIAQSVVAQELTDFKPSSAARLLNWLMQEKHLYFVNGKYSICPPRY